MAVVILAFDTTTRGGSVAVVRDDDVLSLVDGDAARSHGERLPGEIDQALQRASVEKSAIDLIAVASGPGAFTGLRIGLACAQGLSMTLARRVVGIPTLEALAAQGLDQGFPFVAPWMDAQRGDVFAALLAVSAPSSQSPRSVTSVALPVAAHPLALLDEWRTSIGSSRALFIGDAAARDAQAIERIGAGQWLTRLPAPLAPAIARLARQRADGGEAGLPHQLVPIYLRRPDAEIDRDARGRG